MFLLSYSIFLFFFFFFFNDTATTEIYTLSLHDALPISRELGLAAAASGRLRAGLPAGRHRGVRFRPARCRTHPAGYRLRLALRLRLRRPVGEPARVRFAGTDGERLQCRRSGGFRGERAETAAGTSARPRNGLSD